MEFKNGQFVTTEVFNELKGKKLKVVGYSNKTKCYLVQCGSTKWNVKGEDLK